MKHENLRMKRAAWLSRPSVFSFLIFHFSSRPRRRIAICALLALLTGLLCVSAAAEEITVAAASDLQFALREIAQNYEKKTGNTVQLTFGSSGALAAQIQNGAPFDVFFSADASYPETLAKNGAADGKTLVRYARGVLVLWQTKEIPIGGVIGGMAMADLNSLASPSIKKIAIANPQHAPYGRAAVEALKKAGVYDKVAEKLVMGENVSQAAQFAESGNAQAALIPLSLAQAPSLMKRGGYVAVQRDTYAPIVQAAVVTKQARNAATAAGFLRYVVSTEGILTLRKYGFGAEELNPKVVVQ
jgi:molybdate transport system substrate-binding protein